jgi:hypothetical protein
MNKLGANITCINAAEAAHWQEQQHNGEGSSSGGEASYARMPGDGSEVPTRSEATAAHIDLAAG